MNIKKYKFQVLTYSAGSRAIQVLEKNGEPYCTISTNLNSPQQDADCIFVKDGDIESEFAEEMVAQGLLILKGDKDRSGYNTYTLYQITPKLVEVSVKD
jgi:hypothetical protein